MERGPGKESCSRAVDVSGGNNQGEPGPLPLQTGDTDDVERGFSFPYIRVSRHQPGSVMHDLVHISCQGAGLLRRCRSACWSLICLLISGVLPLRAQIPPLVFDRISVEEGLSQSIVVSIIQDTRGFLWFGTEDGLNLYDGYSFTILRSDPSD